jgi:hypothetical protein
MESVMSSRTAIQTASGNNRGKERILDADAIRQSRRTEDTTFFMARISPWMIPYEEMVRYPLYAGLKGIPVGV